VPGNVNLSITTVINQNVQLRKLSSTVQQNEFSCRQRGGVTQKTKMAATFMTAQFTPLYDKVSTQILWDCAYAVKGETGAHRMWVNVLPVIHKGAIWRRKPEAKITYIPVQRSMRFES